MARISRLEDIERPTANKINTLRITRVQFSLVLGGFHYRESTLSLHRQKVCINLTTLPFKC